MSTMRNAGSWGTVVNVDVLPLKVGLAELAKANGIFPTKTAFALAVKGGGPLYRAEECVARVVAAGYATMVIIRGNMPRTQRFEIQMTQAGWDACRRMGIEVW